MGVEGRRNKFYKMGNSLALVINFYNKETVADKRKWS